jgi:hypothetical protein
MNSKPSNLKITIYYLFIKQLYFLSLLSSFSFLSHFSFRSPVFFLPLYIWRHLPVSDGTIFSLRAISLRQRSELSSSLAIIIHRVPRHHRPWSLTPPTLTIRRVHRFDLGKGFHVLHFLFEF